MITFLQTFLHKNRSFFEVLLKFYFSKPNDKKANEYIMKKVWIHDIPSFVFDYENYNESLITI